MNWGFVLALVLWAVVGFFGTALLYSYSRCNEWILYLVAGPVVWVLVGGALLVDAAARCRRKVAERRAERERVAAEAEAAERARREAEEAENYKQNRIKGALRRMERRQCARAKKGGRKRRRSAAQ